MKKLIVFCMAVCLTASLMANDFLPPPGTVRHEISNTEINHAEFIDENVITIIDWREYMHWMRRIHGGQSAEFLAVLPDSVILSKSLGTTHLSDWRHPSYNTRPMVGISYEQAMKYNEWRTDRVNELFEIRGITYRVSYCLPTERDILVANRQKRLGFGGNLQELTADKSLLYEYAENLHFQPYIGPDVNVGFRSVARIIIE